MNLQAQSLLVNTPFLKWPGGKRKLSPEILKYFPDHYNRYFEPFLGGGAVFFALQPRTAVLSDINPDLINCYKQIKHNARSLITELSSYRNSENEYYRIRSLEPICPIKRAARFIYLCTLSFNGLYRLNKAGKFNVPYGFKDHVKPCNRKAIISASQMFANIDFECGDFENVLENAEKGDLIYIDPPYTVSHGDNGFIKYNDNIFSWEDQVRLSIYVQDLHKRGCYVVISNADHESIIDLYKDYELIRISRQSTISASREHRRKVTECIFHNNFCRGTLNRRT